MLGMTLLSDRRRDRDRPSEASLTATPASVAIDLGSVGFAPDAGSCTADITHVQGPRDDVRRPGCGRDHSMEVPLDGSGDGRPPGPALREQRRRDPRHLRRRRAEGFRSGAGGPDPEDQVRIRVAVGDAIGRPYVAAGASAQFALSPNAAIPVAGTLDADGYGDETQDLYPAKVGTHAACPTVAESATKVTVGPTSTTKVTVKHRFKSRQPGPPSSAESRASASTRAGQAVPTMHIAEAPASTSFPASRRPRSSWSSRFPSPAAERTQTDRATSTRRPRLPVRPGVVLRTQGQRGIRRT